MKRCFRAQMVLALALVFLGPLSIQANCFLTPSYWHGCGSYASYSYPSYWGGTGSYASCGWYSGGGYSSPWGCGGFSYASCSYPAFSYAAYPTTYSYPTYAYVAPTYPVAYPAYSFAAPTLAATYPVSFAYAAPTVAATYPVYSCAAPTYAVNYPVTYAYPTAYTVPTFSTCPTVRYAYPVYPTVPVAYPTYYYPASPSYYSVPLITSGTTIVSQPAEISKVIPDGQPMLETLPTPGTKPDAKTAPGKSSTPAKDQPAYRDFHRQLLVKFRTADDVPQLVKQAQTAYQNGHYAEAYDRSWAAVQLDSSSSRAWFSKAASELALGQTKDATASADRAALLERLGQKGSLDSLSLEANHRVFLQKAQGRLNREATPRVAAR